MHGISDFLTDDHRACDDRLAASEKALGAGRASEALTAFLAFQGAMAAHFEAEERVLFPAFEVRTGMRMGPTEVMRGEHAQMRQLMAAAVDAVQGNDLESFTNLVETLVVLMQQHNMKEENILYPMCDQHLADDAAALQTAMSTHLAAP